MDKKFIQTCRTGVGNVRKLPCTLAKGAGRFWGFMPLADSKSIDPFTAKMQKVHSSKIQQT